MNERICEEGVVGTTMETQVERVITVSEKKKNLDGLYGVTGKATGVGYVRGGWALSTEH